MGGCGDLFGDTAGSRVAYEGCSGPGRAASAVGRGVLSAVRHDRYPTSHTDDSSESGTAGSQRSWRARATGKIPVVERCEKGVRLFGSSEQKRKRWGNGGCLQMRGGDWTTLAARQAVGQQSVTQCPDVVVVCALVTR